VRRDMKWVGLKVGVMADALVDQMVERKVVLWADMLVEKKVVLLVVGRVV